ncbi:MAG: preprotein translocase [Deltaproteobacteria bacterium RIFCSPLOWO2_02_FULL_47_10]|nr:MAG: preprotein translocase [Deltaproteobacteria bacterium RIFCSPLOWO2_02_FULL_47_10]
MRIGWTEIIVILAVVLILFGAKRLPDLARSIGKSLNEFKKGMKEVTDDIKKDDVKKD